MIYLRNSTEPQELLIPRNGTGAAEGLLFTAVNTVDLTMRIDQEVTDQAGSDLYAKVSVSLPEDIPDGEYEYALSAGDTLVSSGLLVVGDYAKPNEYDKGISYEQYETE